MLSQRGANQALHMHGDRTCALLFGPSPHMTVVHPLRVPPPPPPPIAPTHTFAACPHQPAVIPALATFQASPPEGLVSHTDAGPRLHVALLQPLRVGLIKLLGAPGVARDPATGAAVTGDGTARVDQLVAALSALGWADKAQGVLAPPVDVAAPGDHLAQQREEEEAGHVWGSLEGLLLVALLLCLAPDPVAQCTFIVSCVLSSPCALSPCYVLLIHSKSRMVSPLIHAVGSCSCVLRGRRGG